ncbi:MAG: two-component system sensor histidine kinase MprB [Verrucomicrobiales bacterium]
MLGSLLGVALAAGLGALVARRLTAPISEVAAAAQAMATHRDLPSRIEVTRTDEVGELATSFNQMLSALELSRDQQKRLVADASHELRTPLTSLRLKIDLLDSNPDLPDGQRRELLGTSAAEVERLSDLVSELVDLATDPTGVEEKPSTQSLARLVTEVAERSELMSGREVSVVALDGQRDVAIRPRMIRRAVSNLIDNALKYSDVGSPVTVYVDDGRVEVRDAGEGIPAADLEHVFDRFFRSPKARTRPGNGIGLAIVQRVADIHGGTTWAHNSDDGAQGAIVGFSVLVDGPSAAAESERA